MKNKIYDLLLQKGAIMEGHFVLTSGLHSITSKSAKSIGTLPPLPINFIKYDTS